MTENATIGELAKALAAFQLEVPSVGKGESASYETKTGGRVKYTYADLADVSKAVLPALARHGLAWICTLNDWTLTAMLVHGESGQSITSTWGVPVSDDPKVVGSSLTYGRRYLLMTMTGVHPDGEDDDGDAAVGRQRPAEATPLFRTILKGREAGVTDEAIRAELDDVAQGRPHGELSADDLRPLYSRYVSLLAKRQAHAEAAASAGPNSPQATTGQSTVVVPEDVSESSTVDSSETVAEPEPVAAHEDWPDTAAARATDEYGGPKTAAALAALGTEDDPYGGADPEADAVAEPEPETAAAEAEPVVAESGATAADEKASRNAVAKAKADLNAKLAARNGRQKAAKSDV